MQLFLEFDGLEVEGCKGANSFQKKNVILGRQVLRNYEFEEMGVVDFRGFCEESKDGRQEFIVSRSLSEIELAKEPSARLSRLSKSVLKQEKCV